MEKVTFDRDIEAFTLETCLDYYNKLGLAVYVDEGTRVTVEIEE